MQINANAKANNIALETKTRAFSTDWSACCLGSQFSLNCETSDARSASVHLDTSTSNQTSDNANRFEREKRRNVAANN